MDISITCSIFSVRERYQSLKRFIQSYVGKIEFCLRPNFKYKNRERCETDASVIRSSTLHNV